MSSSVCNVLFFASLRDEVGRDSVTLDLDAPVSLPDLLEHLSRDLSAVALAALQAENVRVAVNQSFLSAGELIQPGDEVAFMPPVTGG